MKISQVVRVAAIAITSGLAGGAVVWTLQGHSLTILPGGISYADMVAVFLMGIGLVVSILAIAVAILAVWGFKHFRSTARTVATQVATKNSSQVAEDKINQYWRDSVPDMISVQVRNSVEEIMKNPKQFAAWSQEKLKEKNAMDELDDSEA